MSKAHSSGRPRVALALVLVLGGCEALGWRAPGPDVLTEAEQAQLEADARAAADGGCAGRGGR